MPTLINDIDAFCKAYGMADSRFGELAMNDKPFVHQLRSGRRVWPETEVKVRQFMAEYSPPAEQAAA